MKKRKKEKEKWASSIRKENTKSRPCLQLSGSMYRMN